MRFAHIGAVTRHVMADLEDAAGPLLEICRTWPDVVGSAVAAHAAPVALRRKTLVVNVSGSVWLQELAYSSEDIRDAVNALLGSPVLERIQFRVGPVKNGRV